MHFIYPLKLGKGLESNYLIVSVCFCFLSPWDFNGQIINNTFLLYFVKKKKNNYFYSPGIKILSS